MKRNLIIILTGVCMAVLFGQHLLEDLVEIKSSDFRVQGKTLDGKGEWTLSGQEAVVALPIVKLQECHLEVKNNDGEVYVVRSHHCRYMGNMQVVKSASPVYFSCGKKLKGSGIGYDLFQEKKILKIRSHVHVVIEIPRSSASELVNNKDKETSK